MQVALSSGHGRVAQGSLDSVDGGAGGRGAAWDECAPLFVAARNADVGWWDESVEALARVVGACLLETGHADVWRALFVLLLAKFDIWTGWNAGYDLGNEAAFVREAGRWERDKGVCGEGAE